MNWNKTFIYQGKPLHYNRIPVNNCSERAVEVPIAFNFLAKLKKKSKILEVGNALYFYENSLSEFVGIRPRRIVDKFEQCIGVDNVDLMNLPTEEKYDAIVSVSTVEHIGQGLEPSGFYGEQHEIRDLEAPLKAIAKIYDLLSAGGKALITVPFGRLIDAQWFIQFGREYKELLVTKYGVDSSAISIVFLKRLAMEIGGSYNPYQLWVEAEESEVSYIEYDWPLPGANAIAVIEITKLSNNFNLYLDIPATSLNYETLISKPQNVTSELIQATQIILEHQKDINLILFLDWLQSEESISSSLKQAIKSIINHPNKKHLNLFIDTSGISEEEANLFLSSVLMSLFLEEDLHINNDSDEPGIYLLGKLSRRQLQALLTRIHARIILENENKQLIAQVETERIPAYTTGSFSLQQLMQLDMEN